MAYELEGTIKVIMDIQTSPKGFTKREFVVTTLEERYPQDIRFEFVKDKVSLLDRYRPGQRVKVGFDLRGGEYNGRFYVNLQAWRIHPADGSEGDVPSEEAPRSSGFQGGQSAGYQGGGGGGGGGGGYQGGGGSGYQGGGGGGGYKGPPRKDDRRQSGGGAGAGGRGVGGAGRGGESNDARGNPRQQWRKQTDDSDDGIDF